LDRLLLTLAKQYSMCEILINILGTVIGGLFLTLILFILNDFVFPKRNLTGEWTSTIKINKTSYKPFEDLSIEYKIHIIQKEYYLTGSGEKIKDIHDDGTETVFVREKRVLIDVDGYYERKYLAKHKVYLNINEEGRKRETRATYFLVFCGPNELQGTFISTAGDASGTVIMKKS
jgi:hypothetical protein